MHSASEPRGSADDRRSACGGPRSCRAARREEASEADELVQHAEPACVAQRAAPPPRAAAAAAVARKVLEMTPRAR